MVFLECALFVNKLSSDGSHSATVWVEQHRDSSQMYNVVHNIQKWGEAIAEKMRIVELKERDILLRLTEGKTDTETSPCLPEEPVFPDERDSTSVATSDVGGEARSEGVAVENLQTISYAIKMSACALLLEITRFLRNTPDHFISPIASVSQVSTPRVSVSNIDRTFSNTSMISSDVETVVGSRLGSTGTLGRAPRLGVFGSSLSVEDAESSPFDYRHSVSVEEGSAAPGSSSPRKKRASVYLRVTATGGTSGTLSRATSVRKQSRLVRLGDSTSSDHHGSLHQRSPSTIQRRPRKSTAIHTSFYSGSSRSGRPLVAPTSTTVGSYHPVPPKYRRKSMGAPLLSKEKEVHKQDGEVSPSLSSSHHRNIATPSPSQTKASQGSSFLGSTIGQKLRRSAQRAFRRGNRQTSKRLQSEQALSPSSSPGPVPRKRLMSGSRPSVGAGSTTQSIGPHPPPPEEGRKQYPWLDIVEHIILADLTNPEARVRHALTCKALTAALNMIYSNTYEEQNEENQTDGGKKTSSATLKKMSRSLSTLFAHQLSQVDSEVASLIGAGQSASSSRGRQSQVSRATSLPSVRRRTMQKSRSTTARLASVPASMSSVPFSPSFTSDPLARLSFANMSYAQFTSSFLAATASGSSEGGIELFLEEESSFPRPYLVAELDKQRREYIKSEYLGLLHAPLSVLIHAAPVLHESTFTSLKTVVWDLLLDSDPELAKAAGMDRKVLSNTSTYTCAVYQALSPGPFQDFHVAH